MICSIGQGQENFPKLSRWFHKQITQEKDKCFKINA